MQKATYKLQCLNIAKSYLKNTLPNALSFFNDNAYFRDDFQDQLNTNFRDFLLTGTSEELNRQVKGADLCKDICDDKFTSYIKERNPVRARHDYNIKQKEKIRMIENPTKRIIHFTFNVPFPLLLNEFSKRLPLLFNKGLEQYVEEYNVRINEYVEKIKNDELEEGEESGTPYPIEKEDTTLKTIDISSITKLSLSTADDPFFNLPQEHKKYFPQMIVYDKEGDVLETVDESLVHHEEGGEVQIDTTINGSTFNPYCRDNKLKINDDRKATISLNKLENKAQQVLFFIRTKNVDSKSIGANEFDRATFRLLNDETNQSIDEETVKNALKLPTNEEGEDIPDEEPPAVEGAEEPADGEEGADTKPGPEKILLIGRVYYDNKKWIYEKYNFRFYEDNHPEIFKKLGQVERDSR